jgi:hypothetical protein
MLTEQALDVIGPREIEIGVDRNEDTAAAHALKPPHQMTSQEPGPACDDNPLGRKMDHECLPSAATAT